MHVCWRRLWRLPLVLLGVSVVVFVLTRSLPGDPTLLLLPPSGPTAEREAVRQELGLDLSWGEQYLRWLGGVVRGRWGYSLIYHQPVTTLLGRRLGYTLLLSLSALLLGGVVALALGMVAALLCGSIFDRTVRGVASLGVSLPAFFLGLLIFRVLAFSLGWFPVSPLELDGRGLLARLALPLFTVSMLQASRYLRFVRSFALDVLQQDYLRYAFLRGFSRRRVVLGHMLPNVLPPTVNLLCLSLGNVFSGAVVTETVFAWPGMGQLVYQGVAARDYPVLIAATMLFALMTTLSFVLADMLRLVLQPESRGG